MSKPGTVQKFGIPITLVLGLLAGTHTCQKLNSENKEDKLQEQIRQQNEIIHSEIKENRVTGPTKEFNDWWEKETSKQWAKENGLFNFCQRVERMNSDSRERLEKVFSREAQNAYYLVSNIESPEREAYGYLSWQDSLDYACQILFYDAEANGTHSNPKLKAYSPQQQGLHTPPNPEKEAKAKIYGYQKNTLSQDQNQEDEFRNSLPKPDRQKLIEALKKEITKLEEKLESATDSDSRERLLRNINTAKDFADELEITLSPSLLPVIEEFDNSFRQNQDLDKNKLHTGLIRRLSRQLNTFKKNKASLNYQKSEAQKVLEDRIELMSSLIEDLKNFDFQEGSIFKKLSEKNPTKNNDIERTERLIRKMEILYKDLHFLVMHGIPKEENTSNN